MLPPSAQMGSSGTSGFQTVVKALGSSASIIPGSPQDEAVVATMGSSTGRGVLIGMVSAFGTAALVGLVLLIIYFFNFTQRGRILLDRLGRPGEFDDEQQFAKEEAEALEEMDEMQRMEYMRAKAFIQANPPESVQTDISLSQFLAIQEKGVSAWEFEPELEIANCFVEGRTQIEFYDSECSVQSNLPIPKQNEVYYWEAKIYEKPDNTMISIGMTTKPYPLFRLPGFHKTSLAYVSNGTLRQSYPFLHPPVYGPPGGFVQGDVIGCGYRPRTGSVFFTRNGKKLEDVAHGFKAQNFFPTVGAIGPCQVHVNFGQLGFVFIEANVKKWGLAPMTGSLAPPPPYGSEQGSILLEGGREGVREGMGLSGYAAAAAAAVQYGWGHGRSSSQQVRLARSGMHPTSPGPQRSPTDISLAQFSIVDYNLQNDEEDVGEGTSGSVQRIQSPVPQLSPQHPKNYSGPPNLGVDSRSAALASQQHTDVEPPEYTSPQSSPDEESQRELGSQDESDAETERQPLVRSRRGDRSPPIPSYDFAVAESQRGTPVNRGRSETR